MGRGRQGLLRGLLSVFIALASVVTVTGAAVAAAPSQAAEQGADLGLTKSVAEQTTVTGTEFTYTFTVRNRGPETADNTVLTDYLQPGATFERFGDGADVCTFAAATRVLTCDLGDLGSGASRTLEVVFSHAEAGTYTDYASVASDTPDPNIRNNQARATATVTGPNLSLRQTADPTTTTTGTGIKYTFAITNRGLRSAESPRLTDVLPVGVDYLGLVSVPADVTCSFTEATRTLACVFPDLAAGQSRNVRISVDYDVAGTYENTARVTTTSPDPNIADNRATTVVRVS